MTTKASLLASIILTVWGFYGERSSTATGAVSDVRGHSCNDQHSQEHHYVLLIQLFKLLMYAECVAFLFA